ncbi:MAG: CoA ester lyase, partial [Sphingomonadales bacterium]|nr:CoA ester lyase [Sphingomonadales bacterium]
MPATNARAVEKARTLDADTVILDLEDSVAPEQKADARQMLVEALSQGSFNANVAVRVNGLESPWTKDDLAAISEVSENIFAVVMPKIETRQNVLDTEQLMFLLGYPPSVSLWAMVETPKAIFNLEDIISKSKRLSGLVFGVNDFASMLGVPPSRRAPLTSHMQQVVAAAKGNGLWAIDGVYNNLKDAYRFKVDCTEGAKLGFDGKSLIHPNQIFDANEAFTPSEEDVEKAQAMIAAFEAGVEQGLGIIQFEGEMVEALHVAAAKKLIA